MFWNQIKTAILLASLSALLFLLGFWIGGNQGLMVMFVFSMIMNFAMYFWSDKLVLSMYRAQPLDPVIHKRIYDIVGELCEHARIPMPKLWFIETSMANAFATGRNPQHASVAVTRGLLEILDENEVRGVLAHELGHVKNRDILIATIAATIATAIGYVAHMLQWTVLLGGRSDKDRGNAWGALIAALIMPLAATLIQLAISRSREYLADESGADFAGDPLALASALEKLSNENRSQHIRPESTAQTASASLFIVYPFSGGGILSLFSTHPPMEKRIARLRGMAKKYR
ncbi:MAG: Protease HtpX-like protein [candidate division TM6 bacterium GW2011_GWF2_38_10]|nr:MAG: Protease HtpX-like protein [candidate division TM6 bacterium GW2011_GWF2_38_10]